MNVQFSPRLADGAKCPYCGNRMYGAWKRRGRKKGKMHLPHDVTREHVIPHSQGGRIVIAACRRCNHDKANLTPTEWLAVLRERQDQRLERVAKVFQMLGIKGARVADNRMEKAS